MGHRSFIVSGILEQEMVGVRHGITSTDDRCSWQKVTRQVMGLGSDEDRLTSAAKTSKFLSVRPQSSKAHYPEHQRNCTGMNSDRAENHDQMFGVPPFPQWSGRCSTMKEGGKKSRPCEPVRTKLIFNLVVLGPSRIRGSQMVRGFYEG